MEEVEEAEEGEEISYCEIVAGEDDEEPDEDSLGCGSVDAGDSASLGDVRHMARLKVESARALDLSALSEAVRMETLYLAGTRLTDYSWISGLTRLKHVNLAGTEIEDIGFLEGSKGLKWLDISDTEVKSLAPLSKMKKLEELYLGSSPVDPKELRNLRRKLPGVKMFVGLCGHSLPVGETRAACPVSGEADFSGLDRLEKLKVLHLYGNESSRPIADRLKKEHPSLKTVFHLRVDSEAPGMADGLDESTIFNGVRQMPSFLDGGKKVVVSRKPGRSASGFPLPGPCVNPLLHAAVKRGYYLEGPEEELDLPGYEPFPDLDGDGLEEMLVYADFNVNIETMLYVMKGTCGHLVGEFAEEGTPDTALTARVKGLSDILIKHVSVVPRFPVEYQTKRFTGKTYDSNPKNAGFIPMRTDNFREYDRFGSEWD